MRSRDCRHYSRRELIEIIYELERREVRLERKLEKTREKLKIPSFMKVHQVFYTGRISSGK